MAKKQIPHCYDCEYRRDIPGDAHSQCDNPNHPKVKGHPIGLRGGWFMWPWNFDPTWLMECNGFVKKGD